MALDRSKVWDAVQRGMDMPADNDYQMIDAITDAVLACEERVTVPLDLIRAFYWRAPEMELEKWVEEVSSILRAKGAEVRDG